MLMLGVDCLSRTNRPFACSNSIQSLVLRLYLLLLVRSPSALAVVTSSFVIPSPALGVAVSALVVAAAIIFSSLFYTLPFPVPIVRCLIHVLASHRDLI